MKVYVLITYKHNGCNLIVECKGAYESIDSAIADGELLVDSYDNIVDYDVEETELKA